MNLKKRALLIAVLLMLFLIAREAGFVNAYFFSFTADTKIQSDFSGSESKTVITENTSEGTHYGLGVHVPDGSLFVDLKNDLAKNPKLQTQTSFTIEEVTLTGAYWLPLKKSGTSHYRVRFGSGVEIKGTTEFVCSGLAPMRTLKQQLSSEIATKLAKSLEDATRP